uniref:F-box domain-containing protein n=1 Tax=Caenorhabditis tropicalis TaxID=1561998 RepID=A0A1I7T2T3_9PELO
MGAKFSIIDVPEEVTKSVLEHCDIFEILSLRKTCHDIRNVIEDMKPRRVVASNIIFDETRVLFNLFLTNTNCPMHYPDGNFIGVVYEKEGDGCSVRRQRMSFEQNPIVKRFETLDFITAACNDFETVLQTATLKSFNINLQTDLPEGVVQRLQTLLNSKPVEYFATTIEKPEQVMTILPFIIASEVLNIRNPHLEIMDINGDELISLVQWKRAKRFGTDRIRLEIPIRALLHLEKCDLYFKTITSEMLALLKNEFLKIPHLNHFQVQFDSFPDQDSLDFGPPLITSCPSGTKKNWIFSIPETDQFLSINIYSVMVNLIRIEGCHAKEKTSPKYNKAVDFYDEILFEE